MQLARRIHAPVILPADPDCSVLRDAVLDVREDGRIAYCGAKAVAPSVEGVAETRLTGILMPGLVNTHAHTAMTPLRGMGGDLPLMSWLQDVIWPAEARMRGRDAYAGMLLGCVEMLQYGITTSAEMYIHSEEVVAAALTAGIRALVAPAYFDLPGTGWRSALSAIGKWIDEDGLRFGPAERIELCYGPHSAYTLPFEALRATAEAAVPRGALVHIHLAESREEDRRQRAEFGSVPQLLDSAGLLETRLLAAHAVHLSRQDIRLLAGSGAGVAHCPGSNAKLASGTADLRALRAASVAVGLGTDGPASNDDLDPWEEMRLAMMFARLLSEDALALTARDALLMATREGAAALGRRDIGALEPGRWADVIHIGVDGPHFAAGLDIADEQLMANLVWAAGSRAVRDVWVGGQQVTADGEPLFVDRVAAQRAVAEAAAHLVPTAYRG
ncbi:amidohydrolase family protein [Streptomyces sp. NBC_00996]|uniref:amidohydrolase family protein n=1 Tax=Streptomyces sp. NBC_00996 TaxID=2903710 RepID=UPI003865FA1F|nr:amidohydrolase [Streptomyces sp. NBC_00996]